MIRFTFTFFHILVKYFLVSINRTMVKIGLDYRSEVLWSLWIIYFTFIFHIHAIKP